MRFSEKYGNDIEEAVGLALKDLRVPREQVEVEVLEEPSRGFLGIGSKLAKVRVTVIEEDEDPGADGSLAEDPAAVSDGAAKASPAEETGEAGYEAEEEKTESGTAEEKSGEKTEDRPKRSIITERPDDLVEVEEHKALDFLRQTTADMGLDLSFKASVNDENVYVDITGKDAGSIIGKRGQTLDAIQYLTSLVVNKGSSKYIRVILDAENYRARREKTLQQLADRLAGKVIRTKKSVKLEPMNPYERMVIHSALHNNKKVKTRSEGEEPYRRVIIELK